MLPLITVGIIEASITRKFSTPRTFSKPIDKRTAGRAGTDNNIVERLFCIRAKRRSHTVTLKDATCGRLPDAG